jgi:hypothetical protein
MALNAVQSSGLTPGGRGWFAPGTRTGDKSKAATLYMSTAADRVLELLRGGSLRDCLVRSPPGTLLGERPPWGSCEDKLATQDLSEGMPPLEWR